MPKEADIHGNLDAAATAHERQKANPEPQDVSNPKEVWKDAETTPSRKYNTDFKGGRVADAGDIGEGSPSPYSTETQADQVAKQGEEAESPAKKGSA